MMLIYVHVPRPANYTTASSYVWRPVVQIYVRKATAT